MTLFAELKRRNVFRVGLEYLVAAWLLVQVAALLLDVIGAPPVVMRSVAVLLALGFIPTVIFAWVYELTPEGVDRIETDRALQRLTRKMKSAERLQPLGTVAYVKRVRSA